MAGGVSVAVLAASLISAVSGGASAAAPVIIDLHVVASSDDAEESATGVMSTNSSDLELVLDSSLQTVGVRFRGVGIPPGSTITSAWAQFETDEAKSKATSLTIKGQAADNPATFASTARNISTRPRTDASVSWVPPVWTVLQERAGGQRTPDLTPVLNEIVSRPGWASGNAVVLVITGTGVRTAEAFDGTRAPSLHVEFLPPTASNTAPTVNAGPDQTILSSVSATLGATAADDGLPVVPGITSVAWTAVAGPGGVTFSDPAAAVTTATFAVEGTFTLRVTASDGLLTSSDDVVVTVVPGDGWVIRSVDSGASTWTGSAADDPIVFPGQPGAAHMHDFFCNQATTAFSTYESMTAATSVCPSGDTAGYWAPALFRNGVKVDPHGPSTRQQFYYRDNNVPAGSPIVPFPPDFRMVIGNPHATTLAEANAAGVEIGGEQYWGCSDNSEIGKATAPIDCPTGVIALHIGFPNCWNGVKVSGDQIAAGTLRYPVRGVCPAGFTTILPRLIERFEYPVGPSSAGITLSSGSVYSIHADFWNTWQQSSLERLVTLCLDGLKTNCGINPSAGVNQPPTVSAGPDRGAVQPDSVQLTGTVSDDGLPGGTTTTSWSVVSGPGQVTFVDAGAPTTTASFSAPGGYVLRLTATDGALTATDDVLVAITDAGATNVVVEVAVDRRSDDAEEVVGSGAVNLSSSDLELINESIDQVVGVRFAGLQIPRGSHVVAAWVQFETDEVKSAATSLIVQAQAADDPPTFTTTAFDISSRPRTSATSQWALPPWTTLQERGAAQRTPNLAAVVQQVVDRPGWAAGQAIAILITGSGVRTAEAFDGTAPPVLHVEFVPPPA